MNTDYYTAERHLQSLYGNNTPAGIHAIPIKMNCGTDEVKAYMSATVSESGKLSGFRYFWDKRMTLPCSDGKAPTPLLSVSDFQAMKMVSILISEPTQFFQTCKSVEVLRAENANFLEFSWITAGDITHKVIINQNESSIEYYTWHNGKPTLNTISNIGAFIRYLNTLNIHF